jgi:hypothetical protein
MLSPLFLVAYRHQLAQTPIRTRRGTENATSIADFRNKEQQSNRNIVLKGDSQ